jgi:hypothetical protein
MGADHDVQDQDGMSVELFFSNNRLFRKWQPGDVLLEPHMNPGPWVHGCVVDDETTLLNVMFPP